MAERNVFDQEQTVRVRDPRQTSGYRTVDRGPTAPGEPWAENRLRPLRYDYWRALLRGDDRQAAELAEALNLHTPTPPGRPPDLRDTEADRHHVERARDHYGKAADAMAAAESAVDDAERKTPPLLRRLAELDRRVDRLYELSKKYNADERTQKRIARADQGVGLARRALSAVPSPALHYPELSESLLAAPADGDGSDEASVSRPPAALLSCNNEQDGGSTSGSDRP